MIAGQTGNAPTFYNGCDTADIVLCTGLGAGQVWSMCNVGTTTAGTTAVSYGIQYQWGRNDTGFTTSTSLTYDWQSPQNDNAWGDTTNTSIARQGPCTTGYHVPSRIEFSQTAYNTFPNGAPGNAVNFPAILKMPYAGYRILSDGSLAGQGTYGYSWSSSPVVTFGYTLAFFSSTAVYPASYYVRAFGYSVRCLKN